MRGRLALALALLAAPAIAGCIQGAQAATAEEQADPATERAQDWAEDAQLASAEGMEGSYSGTYGAGGDHWDRAAEDEEVGDGRCKVWRYTYVADSKPDEAYVIVLDEGGEVLDEETRARSDDEVALGDWGIDSDEALETAKETNQHLADGLDSENYGLFLQLDRDPDDQRPIWLVAGGGGDGSGGGGGFVVIDAVTGDVLQSSGGSSGGYDRPER